MKNENFTSAICKELTSQITNNSVNDSAKFVYELKNGIQIEISQELCNKIAKLCDYEPKTKKESQLKDLMIVQCNSPFPGYFYGIDELKLLKKVHCGLIFSQGLNESLMHIFNTNKPYLVLNIEYGFTDKQYLVLPDAFNVWDKCFKLDIFKEFGEDVFKEKNLLGLGLSLADCHKWYWNISSLLLGLDEASTSGNDKSTGLEKDCA